MSNWPFIAGAYAVALAGVFGLGITAWWRARRAAARLAVLEASSPRRKAQGLAGALPDAAP